MLGDIIINLYRAVGQAEEFGHSKEREMAYLSVHGFLHILGYDHYDPEEKRKMTGKGRRNTWCLRYGTYCNGRKTWKNDGE